MKVIQKHEFKDGKFIFTRTVSEFTDYELEVLRKLYKNQGLSTYADEFAAKYNAVIYNLIEVGLIYKDYEIPAKGTYYQMSDCIKDILGDNNG